MHHLETKKSEKWNIPTISENVSCADGFSLPGAVVGILKPLWARMGRTDRWTDRRKDGRCHSLMQPCTGTEGRITRNAFSRVHTYNKGKVTLTALIRYPY